MADFARRNSSKSGPTPTKSTLKDPKGVMSHHHLLWCEEWALLAKHWDLPIPVRAEVRGTLSQVNRQLWPLPSCKSVMDTLIKIDGMITPFISFITIKIFGKGFQGPYATFVSCQAVRLGSFEWEMVDQGLLSHWDSAPGLLTQWITMHPDFGSFQRTWQHGTFLAQFA